MLFLYSAQNIDTRQKKVKFTQMFISLRFYVHVPLFHRH